MQTMKMDLIQSYKECFMSLLSTQDGNREMQTIMINLCVKWNFSARNSKKNPMKLFLI